MQKGQIFSWVLVIAWMCVIFMFSEQDGVESGNLSNSFVDSICAALSKLHINITNVEIVSFIIRKLAHMFIYFVLALLVMNAFRFSNITTISTVLFTVLICFLYACSDEFHQSFTPGRNMSFYDVLIDTAGAILGIVTFLTLTQLGQRFFSSR